jgi:LPS O-antigen subunit length determinant protein (WzzB/FepE family)
VQKNFGTGPEAKRFKIEAKIPQDSRIIIIESKGPDTDQALHVKLHSQILDKLAQDHDPEVDFVKLTMENELNRTRNQLDKLKDEAVLLQSQGKRLDEQELLLREQLKDIEKLIDSSEANRNKAVAEVEGEAKAMTLMLIDNETKKYLDRAGEIKERLLVGLSDDRDKLKNDLAENLRSQTELQEKLQELQAKIVNVRYTRSILPTIRSMESEGPGKPVIMVLAVVFGLIAGIFAAFVAEFRLKVKERLNERPAR